MGHQHDKLEAYVCVCVQMVRLKVNECHARFRATYELGFFLYAKQLHIVNELSKLFIYVQLPSTIKILCEILGSMTTFTYDDFYHCK